MKRNAGDDDDDDDDDYCYYYCYDDDDDDDDYDDYDYDDNHNHKCTQLNPPIREFIKITIATTTYPTQLRIFQNGQICNIRQCLRQ